MGNSWICLQVNRPTLVTHLGRKLLLLLASRESTVTLQTLMPVHATHDLHQGPRVVKVCWLGTVVNSFPNWSSTTYSVEFELEDVPGGTLTMSGLTELDVQPD